MGHEDPDLSEILFFPAEGGEHFIVVTGPGRGSDCFCCCGGGGGGSVSRVLLV